MYNKTVRNNEETKNSFIGFVLVIMGMMIACVPVIDYYCNWYVTIIPVFFLAFILNKNEEITYVFKYFALALIYSVLSFWFIYRENSFVNKLTNDFVLWVSIIYTYYISLNMDKKHKKIILQLLSVLLLITAVTTIIGLKVYPNASRELASGTVIYDTNRYRQINIGGYDFIYGLIVFVPFQIWLIKNTQSWIKVFNIFVMVMLFYVVVESSYTTALLLFIMFLVFCMLKFSVKRFVFYAVILALVFFLFRDLIINILEFIRSTIALDYVSDRILQIIQLLGGQSVHTHTSSSRIDMFQNTIQAFLDNPILGGNILNYNKQILSHHSTILDTLASGGIIFLIVYICIFRAAFKISRVATTNYSAAFCQSIIAFFAVAIMNPVNSPLMYFVLLIAGGCVNSLEKDEEEIGALSQKT